MDWAFDKWGKQVDARSVGLYRYGFTCPCCREPVFHRSGTERRPHFAHFSASADRDCELYSQDGGSTTPDALRRANVAVPRHIQNVFRSSLCLHARDLRASNLQLRLPVVKDMDECSGQLVMRSSYGTQRYDAQKLCTPRYFPVDLCSPPAECEAPEELGWAVADINSTLARFGFKNNYFAGSSGGGALLPQDAPLEAGLDYWLLTQSALAAPPIADVRVKLSDETRGWRRYLVHVSPRVVLDSPGAVSLVQNYLGRRIISPRATAFIQWPSPHHFESDGTEIYGEEVVRLAINCPNSGVVELRSSALKRAVKNTGDLNTVEVSVEEFADETIELVVDGRLQSRLRIEQCPNFRPQGVTVRLGEARCELFEEGVVNLTNCGETCNLEVPTHRVWRSLQLSGSKLNPLPNGTLISLEPRCTSIDADNFGRWAMAASVQPGRNAVDRKFDETALRYLAPIVLRFSDATALERLRLVDGSRASLARWATSSGLRWLEPQLVNLFGVED